MSSLRIMDSDPGKARRTAAAVQRALEASGEVVVGNASVVPNRRDGARVFMEVLLLEASAASGGDDQELTVERTDRPRPRTRRALPRGGRGEAGA
ncbi:hypothetical protein ACIPJN_39325 [Streptomyces sp. NPDC086796]|uniref:hypothetical protein n=1 Tax=Streptomyces sp. NPDC086796 TaxID=3365760 RepID=UPI0037F9040B